MYHYCYLFTHTPSFSPLRFTIEKLLKERILNADGRWCTEVEKNWCNMTVKGIIRAFTNLLKITDYVTVYRLL